MLDRETLGKLVRSTWVQYCRLIGDTKPSHLVEWDRLPEADKEADRVIGEIVAHAVADEVIRTVLDYNKSPFSVARMTLDNISEYMVYKPTVLPGEYSIPPMSETVPKMIEIDPELAIEDESAAPILSCAWYFGPNSVHCDTCGSVDPQKPCDRDTSHIHSYRATMLPPKLKEIVRDLPEEEYEGAREDEYEDYGYDDDTRSY